MFNWLLKVFNISAISPLSEAESKQVNEAKERTLHILSDALQKKDRLLVEKPEDLNNLSLLEDVALISPSLVQELICELQKVTFIKDNNPKGKTTIAYVYSGSSDRTIYLCPLFWEKQKYLGFVSHPGILIHEVSHFLGYKDSVSNGHKSNAQKPNLCPLTAYNIEISFEILMSHVGEYTGGSYSCCGEKSRDSVCEMSTMSLFLSLCRFHTLQRCLLDLHETLEKIRLRK